MFKTVDNALMCVPMNHKQQILIVPSLLNKTFITISEIIILAFLKEVGMGYLKPDEVELFCDDKRIRISEEGELIDQWPGGFFRERSDLLFYDDKRED